MALVYRERCLAETLILHSYLLQQSQDGSQGVELKQNTKSLSWRESKEHIIYMKRGKMLQTRKEKST